MVNLHKSRNNPSEVNIPVLGVVWIEVARVMIAISTTLDHVVCRHLSHRAFASLFQNVILNVPSTLKLPDAGVDTPEEEVAGKHVLALGAKATPGTESLDAFFDAVDERPVWGVNDFRFFIVFGRGHRGVAVEF